MLFRLFNRDHKHPGMNILSTDVVFNTVIEILSSHPYGLPAKQLVGAHPQLDSKDLW